MMADLAIALLALTLVGCGGTYVNDKHNFERALNFQRPKDVNVVRSIYWQSPHFTDEHCYFLELRLFWTGVYLEGRSTKIKDPAA